MVTDAQVHLWDVDRPDRPWPQPPRGVAQRDGGFSATEMLAEMDAAGVDRAVIVPPIWAGDDSANATAFNIVAQHPRRFAIMGRFDPHWPDAAQRLEGWKQQPGMLGIRLSLSAAPFRDWLDDGILDAFWPACERLAIPVMILVPGLLPQLGRVAERHPSLTLIVDHMGCNLAKRGPEAFPWQDELLALGKHARVHVKVSSAPSMSAEPYPFADLDPYIRQIYETFGAERMLWGADLTRLSSTYQECLLHFKVALDFLSDADRELILGKTAARVLSWPETPA